MADDKNEGFAGLPYEQQPKTTYGYPASSLVPPQYSEPEVLYITAPELDRLRAQLAEANATLAVAVGALDEIKRKVAAYDSPAFAAAVAAAIADETLSTLPAQAAQMLAIVEAAREFRDNGTVLTSCSRGPCQRVIEHEDRSDPQAKLFKALNDFDANRETTRTDRSDG